jgi:chorismate synthase
VAVGDGVAVSSLPGSRAQDAIYYSQERGFFRETNRAGGVEGGITNGEPLTISAYLKPLSTLMRPLPSVDLATKAPGNAQKERSDVCAVPAAAVIGESVMALCLAEFVREKFGSDSMKELVRNYMGYKKQLEDY